MKKFKGKVIKGIQKGRVLGFPTANIDVGQSLDSGIFAGFVFFNNIKHQSALYLPGGKIIEAYIFDFSENLYEKEIEVEIIKKIRKKIDFKTVDEAKKQIAKDIQEIKNILNNL